MAKKKASLWISSAIRKPGSLHKQLGLSTKTKIPLAKLKASAKKGGKLGARARLALVLRSFKKGRRKK